MHRENVIKRRPKSNGWSGKACSGIVDASMDEPNTVQWLINARDNQGRKKKKKKTWKNKWDTHHFWQITHKLLKRGSLDQGLLWQIPYGTELTGDIEQTALSPKQGSGEVGQDHRRDLDLALASVTWPKRGVTSEHIQHHKERIITGYGCSKNARNSGECGS